MMKIKLWKKFGTRVRIVELYNMFEVQIRDKYNLKWHKLREFKTFKEALCQKHHYIRVVLIKDFGLIVRYRKKH